jgi:hypothetical protein
VANAFGTMPRREPIWMRRQMPTPDSPGSVVPSSASVPGSLAAASAASGGAAEESDAASAADVAGEEAGLSAFSSDGAAGPELVINRVSYGKTTN